MDEIEKRREARRRKILENSQNRLGRITGVEQKSTKLSIATVYHNHDSESEILAPVTIPKAETPPQPAIKVKPTQKHYRRTVISALAVAVYLLLLILEKMKFDYSSAHINKIFLPLLVYEIIELVSDKERSQNRSFIFLLLIANSRNKIMQSVIKYVELVTNILQDVMLYFFVFVCCDIVRRFIIKS